MPGRTVDRRQIGGYGITVRATVFIIASALASSAAATPLTSEEDRASFAKTCNHYENRSRFETRGAEQSFTAVLSDNCVSALATLDGTSADAPAAREYLLKLTELKDTIVDLQVRAFIASRETERPKGRYARVLTSISETGEYLIAREIGVVDTLDAWTATETGQKSFAKAVLR